MKFKFPEAQEVILQDQTTIKNEFGEPEITWTDTTTAKVEIFPLSNKYQINLMGVTETSTHIFYSTDNIKSNQRIKTPNGVFFNVQYVQDWGSHLEGVLEKCN